MTEKQSLRLRKTIMKFECTFNESFVKLGNVFCYVFCDCMYFVD